MTRSERRAREKRRHREERANRRRARQELRVRRDRALGELAQRFAGRLDEPKARAQYAKLRTDIWDDFQGRIHAA